MSTNRTPRLADLLGRVRLLGPLLIAVAGLIVSACNNSGSGTGY